MSSTGNDLDFVVSTPHCNCHSKGTDPVDNDLYGSQGEFGPSQSTHNYAPSSSNHFKVNSNIADHYPSLRNDCTMSSDPHTSVADSAVMYLTGDNPLGGNVPAVSQINESCTWEDNDEAYGESLPSSTTSLSSRVYNSNEKFGRQYETHFQHGDFPFPKDKEEQQRLDRFHYDITYYFESMGLDSLHFAPIQPRGRRMLDIGTGTGIWAIQMGKRYPGSLVTGIDLSPIQHYKVSVGEKPPQNGIIVPANVEWVLDDLERDWVEPSHYYIHGRNLGGCIKNWSKLLQQAFQNLESEGWVEFHELSTCFNFGNETDGVEHGSSKLVQILEKACSGRMLDPTSHMENLLRCIGFENVVQKRFRIPIGDWPEDQGEKDVGIGMRNYIIDGMQGPTTVWLKEKEKWSNEEVEILHAKERATMGRVANSFVEYVVTMGQKL